MSDPTITPWYKQFWPWFLLGLLFSSIIVSTTFAVMSIKSYDGMVVQEDYYEHGKAINMVFAKQEQARALNLSAELRIDPLTSDIVVDLAGDARPAKLYLDLIFPTEDDRDQSFVLEHVREGRYITQGPDNLRYRWYLQLQPEQGDESAWRLIGEARFPNENTIALLPGGRLENE
ncbi:FixH family protein [Vreelandella venusta]|uniref:FixH family protein n=1 Tax=Vreelandella venusta TaxID=44935 RepID=UPI0018DA6D40|nr:FixH family protein [Halomonas venusta]QPI63402.1 FixH family protein [Halomonas venusta]WAM47916.1 FixH family protein [Halomonas venusta]